MSKYLNWFKDKFDELKNDFDFRLEELLLDITENITKLMIQKKLSRIKFAKKIGVSTSVVTKILDGNSNFTLKTLLSISDALDCDLKIYFKQN